MGFTVHDVALLLGIMAGYDERDNLSSSTVTPVLIDGRDGSFDYDGRSSNQSIVGVACDV